MTSQNPGFNYLSFERAFGKILQISTDRMAEAFLPMMLCSLALPQMLEEHIDVRRFECSCPSFHLYFPDCINGIDCHTNDEVVTGKEIAIRKVNGPKLRGFYDYFQKISQTALPAVIIGTACSFYR